MGNTINVAGSYIDIHDNEVVNLTVDKALVSIGKEQLNTANDNMTEDKPMVPDELTTDEAICVLNKLVKGGMTDERWQPKNLSNAEKGLLAQRLGVMLDIHYIWKVFGNLWGMKSETLRSAYNKGMEQKRKASDFLEKLNKLLN